MPLVGPERRDTTNRPPDHGPAEVKQRNSYDPQHRDRLCGTGTGLRNLDAKPCHEDSKQCAAGVAHEATDIAIHFDRQVGQQEGYDRGHDDDADRKGNGLPILTRKNCQGRERNHRERTREAIHAIQHIERVHGRNHGDYRHPIRGNPIQHDGLSERRAERLECSARTENEGEGRCDLHRQTRPGRQVESIIDQPDRYKHRTRSEQCAGRPVRERQQSCSEDNAKQHAQPADDRYITRVKLPATRSVNQINGNCNGT